MSASLAGGAAPAAHADQPSPQVWALASLALCVFLCQLDTNIVNVALPTLMQAFGVSFEAVEWVVLTYLLAVTALVVGVGRLGDLLGRRRLFLAGLVLFTLASAACGLAPGFGFLLLARAVQGLGAATLTSLAFALAGELVPTTRGGTALGILGTLSSLGTTLGPPVGGAIISALGWRAMFLINVPLGALALLLARRHLPPRAAGCALRPPFDHLGALGLIATLAAYSVAMNLAQARGFGERQVLALLACAATSLSLFVLRQLRARHPLIQLAAFREPLLSTGLGALMLVMAVMMSTLVLGPFYLSGTLGLSARAVGLVMSVGPLTAALLAAPAGRLADRLGAREVSVAGLVGLTLGAVGLSQLRPASGVAGYLACSVVVTAGYALFQMPNSAAVLAAARPEQRGVVSSLLVLARNLGLITGASLMTTVFASASGASRAGASPEAIAAGLRAAFALASVLGAGALALAGVALRSRRAAPSPAKHP